MSDHMTTKFFSKALPVIFAVSLFAAVNATAFSPGQDGGGGMDSGMSGVSGKVVETMDSGGYTYVLVEKDGQKTWAACPATKVSVGDEIALKPGMAMPNFHSKTLNRSFDSIVFSGGLAN